MEVNLEAFFSNPWIFRLSIFSPSFNNAGNMFYILEKQMLALLAICPNLKHSVKAGRRKSRGQ